MKFFALFCLGLLLHSATCAEVEAQSPAGDESHTTPGFDITFIGKGPNIRLTPSAQNTSFLSIEFGSVYEEDEAGNQVTGRVIESLFAQKPDMSLGVQEIDGTNVTFVLMELELPNVKGTDFNYSACATSVEQDYFDGGGSIKTIVFFGFKEDIVFPYGKHNSFLAPANSTKLGVQVNYWPFCDAKNTLKLELIVKTGAGRYANPMISNLTESDDGDGEVGSDSQVPNNSAGASANEASSGTSAGNTSGVNKHRKILAKPGDPAKVKVVDKGISNSSSTEGAPKQKKKAQKDPRVVGFRKDKVDLLTAPGKAAILDFPTYAYDDVDSDILINITTEVTSYGDYMMVTLGFPGDQNFVYYDPTMQVDVDATEAGYTAAEAANTTTVEEPVTSAVVNISYVANTTGDKKNAAGMRKVNSLYLLAAAAVLFAALL